MMALRWSCSPLSISANSSCSTFVSSPTTDSTISACMLSSGSSSSNSANPCRSFSCAAISSQVETSSRRAFNCCICACALRLSDQKSSAMLSSSRLVICFALFATSKTHHSFMDALLQAFDLCGEFVHTAHCNMFYGICIQLAGYPSILQPYQYLPCYSPMKVRSTNLEDMDGF